MPEAASFSLENSPPLVLAVFFVHLLLTIFLCGIIWFVQTVHYPLFRRIGDYEFIDYHRRHKRFTGLLVGPLMVLEALTAGLLVLLAPGILTLWPFSAALAFIAVIWLSTFLIQVPLHRAIHIESSPLLLRRLVRTNWIRTGAWTARALLLAALWMRQFAP